MSNPTEIAEIDGMSEKSAKTLVWDARHEMGMGEFRSVSEMEVNTKYITTGSANFDAIMGGGIPTGYITEVFGAFKSGKTNLSHTLCVTTQLPSSHGGLGGSVLFIDTENTFSKAKIERIARRFGLDPKEVLRNIYHARIYSSDHQIQMINAAEVAIQTKGAKLVIIDSLMALLRAEYIGIGLLARRQAVLNKIIHEISRLAETYNIAVMVTNQVATVMKGTFTAQDAIGGNIVAHGCQFRVQFKSKGFSMNSSLERTATIVDAVDVPPESCNFFITDKGISDEEDPEFAKESLKKTKALLEVELISAADIDDTMEDTEFEEEEPKKNSPKKKTTKKKGK